MADNDRRNGRDPNASTEQHLGERLFNAACRLSGHLMNHMPLRSFFCYKILSNVAFSNRTVTAFLLIACGIVNFMLCLADMIKEAGGTGNGDERIRYGFATDLDEKDYIHAVLSTALFAAVALTDQNSFDAFYPGRLSHGVVVFLRWVPIFVAFASGFVVIRWPSNRRGIGFLATWLATDRAWLEKMVRGQGEPT